MRYGPKKLKDGNGIMERVNGTFLYELGANLQPLTTIHSGPLTQKSLDLLQNARSELDHLLHAHVFDPATSRGKGEGLLKYLQELVDRGRTIQEGKSPSLSDSEVNHLRNSFFDFSSALTAELSRAPLYFVTPKRGYNLYLLLNEAEKIFPDGLLDKVPSVDVDVEQAGKCLAFNLPTATAFHLHRINEEVLHRYYDAVTGGASRPTGRNMGD